VIEDLGAHCVAEKDFVGLAAYLAGMGRGMELRHLRYFVAVAEVAARRPPPRNGCARRSLPSVDKSAFVDEALCRGETYPRGAAGNHGPLSLQPAHNGHFYFR